MRDRFSRRDVLKGAAGAVGLMAAGCATGPQAPSGGIAPVASPVASGPKRGGTLVLAGSAGSTYLIDPHRMTGGVDLWSSDLVYNQLVRWPKDPEKGLGPEPELAESWETAPDGLSVTLKLRRGVKFQNVAPVNGREFTADDVKWNIQRLSSDKPIFPRRALWKPVKSIDVIDKYTIKFSLSDPWPDMMVQLGQITFKMLAREAVEVAGDDDKFNNNPKLQIGTGPFILTDYQRDVGSKYVRNPEYFKSGQPYPDALQVRWFADQATRFASIRAGDVADSGWFLTATQFRTLQTQSGIVTASRPSTSWHALILNLKVKPFDDVRVRRAVAFALDADAIAKGPWQGGAAANRTAIPAAFKDESLPASEWPKQDLAKAKQLLAEAGLPDGFAFNLLTQSNTEEAKLSGQLIKEQLSKVGITANLELVEFAELLRRAVAKEFDANLGGTWGGDVVLSGYFEPFYLSGAPRNYMSYSNPQFDQAVKDLGRTSDPAKRKDLAYRAQRFLIEDMPVVNLVVPYDFYAWQSWLKGYGTNWLSGGMSTYVDEFWIDK